MTAPSRTSGIANVRRVSQCTSKNRYSDELAARAMGQRQALRQGIQLWVYHCNLCNGWHLTRCDNGDRMNVAYDFREIA